MRFPIRQFPIRQIILALAGFVTFIPYHFIASWLSISLESATNITLTTLQIISSVLLFFCVKKTPHAHLDYFGNICF